MSWTKESVRETLQNNGYQISSESRLSNDTGDQFRCASGEIVCLYDSGKIVAQGKNTDAIKALFGQANSTKNIVHTQKGNGGGNRKVFVVYGHDSGARTQLEAMLRRWGLDPLILDQITSGGKTIIEKLESVRGEANFAVILATPDDQGHRAGHPEENAFRARQNVVLELGMMLSVLGRDRVAILLKGQDEMERPSDIQGLIYIPFKEHVDEIKLTLAKEIHEKGIPIDLKKV